MDDAEARENDNSNNEENGKAYIHWTQEETDYLIEVYQKANNKKEYCEAFRKRYDRTDVGIKKKIARLQKDGIIKKWDDTVANPSSTVTNQNPWPGYTNPIRPCSSSGVTISPCLEFLKKQAMKEQRRLSIQDECSNFKTLNQTGKSSEDLCAEALNYLTKEFQLQDTDPVDQMATVLYCYGIKLTPQAVHGFSKTSIFQLTEADLLTFFLNERIKLGHHSSTQKKTIFKVSNHTIPPFVAQISQNCVLPLSKDDVVKEYMDWVKNDHEKETFVKAYDVFTTSNIHQFQFPDTLTEIKTLFMTQVHIDENCFNRIECYGEFKLDEERKIEKFKSSCGAVTLDRAVKEVSNGGVRKRAADAPKKSELNKRSKRSKDSKMEKVKEEDISDIDASNLAITQSTSRQVSVASGSASVASSFYSFYAESERAASQERDPNITQNTSRQESVAHGSATVAASTNVSHTGLERAVSQERHPNISQNISRPELVSTNMATVAQSPNSFYAGSERAASQERSGVSNTPTIENSSVVGPIQPVANTAQTNHVTPLPPQQPTTFNTIQILKYLKQAVMKIASDANQTAPNAMNAVLVSIESAIEVSHPVQKVPAEVIRKSIEKNLKMKLMSSTYRTPDSKILISSVFSELCCIAFCHLKSWEFENFGNGLGKLFQNYQYGHYSSPKAVEEFFGDVLSAIMEASA